MCEREREHLLGSGIVQLQSVALTDNLFRRGVIPHDLDRLCDVDFEIAAPATDGRVDFDVFEQVRGLIELGREFDFQELKPLQHDLKDDGRSARLFLRQERETHGRVCAPASTAKCW